MLQTMKKTMSRCCYNRRGRLIRGPWDETPAIRGAEAVVEDFLSSGRARRLHLWVQHRDLRPVFNSLAELKGPEDPSLLRVELPRD